MRITHGIRTREHLRAIFTELGLLPPKVDDPQLFEAIVRVAKNAGVKPYAADKVFWLIGSGQFYDDPEIGSKGRTGSHRDDFIKFDQAKL